ncbi:MAG: histidine kinase [Gammaproteobacteria bacterium]|nr:MAG: histidine kinase [Gammaproteobacteria bacterium]
MASTAVLATALISTPIAFAEEVSFDASVSASNLYLFRGFDLGGGSGNAAISGDLTASYSNSYATIWASSGDASLGTEYDLIVGYGRDIGDFNFDINLTNFIYPSEAEGELDTIGELTEVIVSLGYGPVSFSHANNIAGSTGYSYTTFGVESGDFSVLLGHNLDDNDEVEDTDDISATHLDLSYAFNDNLSFTVSKIIAQDDGEDDDIFNENTLFVVTLSLPIDLK